MRSFWATGIGALIGIAGGPVGIGIGAIIGALMDLVLADLRVQREARRLVVGESTRAWLPAELPIAGAVIAATGHQRTEPSRLAPPIEQRLATLRPDRFAARLCERAILTATTLPGDVERAADLMRRCLPLDSRKRVARVVWEVLRESNADPASFRTLAIVAFAAEIDRGFVERELPVETVLDHDACEVLGLGTGATLEQVRQAYRRLASQFHPDTASTLNEAQRAATAEAFIRVQAAYRTLVEQLTGSDRP